MYHIIIFFLTFDYIKCWATKSKKAATAMWDLSCWPPTPELMAMQDPLPTEQAHELNSFFWILAGFITAEPQMQLP